jgi:hypothetical protein
MRKPVHQIRLYVVFVKIKYSDKAAPVCLVRADDGASAKTKVKRFLNSSWYVYVRPWDGPSDVSHTVMKTNRIKLKLNLKLKVE